MLVFSVEFVYLRDAFGTRMNTVFKFYFQAWALLGLAAAFGLYYVLERSGAAAGIGQRLVFAFGLFYVLLAAGLLYPLGASINRTGALPGRRRWMGWPLWPATARKSMRRVQWLNETRAGGAARRAAGDRGGGARLFFLRVCAHLQPHRPAGRDGLDRARGAVARLHDEIAEREQDVNCCTRAACRMRSA